MLRQEFRINRRGSSMNFRYILAILILCLSASRAFGSQPFSMVEVCLVDEENITVFIDIMRSVAKSGDMEFVDSSEKTQRDLEEMGKTAPKVIPLGPVINLGLESNDGAWITANNVGMPRNQVVIGFTEGSNPTRAHYFADKVVNRLKEHWNLEVIPPDVGARGMKTCNG